MGRTRETRAVYAPTEERTDWPPQGEWTYEDYARLPDDGWKYEVMRGVLYMTPAPNTKHQRVIGNLFFALRSHVQPSTGEVFVSPIDVILPNELGTPVQPDILFIAADRLEIVGEQQIEGVPDLVVEVLSPSNWADDRRDKYEVYAEAGVREYWLVDPRQRTIEVFVLRNGSYELLGKWGAGEVARSQILDGFSVAVDEVVPA